MQGSKNETYEKAIEEYEENRLSSKEVFKRLKTRKQVQSFVFSQAPYIITTVLFWCPGSRISGFSVEVCSLSVYSIGINYSHKLS